MTPPEMLEQDEEIVTTDVEETPDVEVAETPADATPDDAETADPDTPSADEDAEGEGGDEAAPAPKPVVVKPTPYLARVLGQQYEAEALGLKGAQARPDGVVEFPPETQARLSQLLSKGRMYEERVPQQLHEARQEAQRARAEFNEDAERGRALFEFFSGIATRSEQEIYDFVMDFKNNKPLLDAKVERALAQAQWQAAQRGQMAQQGAYNLPPEVIEAQAQDAAWQRVQAVRSKVKGLTDEQAFDVASKLWRNKALYLGIADRDYPEAGVVRGQPVFNVAKWDEDFADRAQDYVRGAQTLAQAAKVKPKVQAAAAGNAAVLGKSGGKAPPPPPGGAASVGKAQGKETEAQYKARMKRQYGYVPRGA